MLACAVLAVVCLVAACSRQGVPQHLGVVTLLRFGQLDARPAALFEGRISFANGCASVEGPGGVPVTGLWPPDTRLDATSGRMLIVVQGVAFAEGDEVSMGGSGVNTRTRLGWSRSSVPFRTNVGEPTTSC